MLSNDTPLGEWIEVRYLKEGMEIAVPDYSTGAIKWEKIISIKTLEPQHVYDLSIEGTRNFIANDIVAHNTYLATSGIGNVGINTTTPSDTLSVNGTVRVVTGSGSQALFVNPSGNVGIGTTSPGRLLEVAGSINGTQLNISGPANLAYGSGRHAAGENQDVCEQVEEGGMNLVRSFTTHFYISYYKTPSPGPQNPPAKTPYFALPLPKPSPIQPFPQQSAAISGWRFSSNFW